MHNARGSVLFQFARVSRCLRRHNRLERQPPLRRRPANLLRRLVLPGRSADGARDAAGVFRILAGERPKGRLNRHLHGSAGSQAAVPAGAGERAMRQAVWGLELEGSRLDALRHLRYSSAG